ncbi:DUF4037 domain-containing protein [Paenibacillus sp. CF384]|uniref:DUF4037 domain-containing protein n=1 Tax=Paenibacillus sp. CF384 TaxID=1884382 RepID=UPI00089512C3|nr:DUF4037 domain-containing protein [Paenibacillus sp. CF384]SDW78141.1 protein of unknown function [Paenibacillus sp. CF384]
MQGIELCRRYYEEIVEPQLAVFTSIAYSAALIGPGSEVLGFDTEMSQDHDWGPRTLIFLHDSDEEVAERLRASIIDKLPETFYGFPVEAEKTVITTLQQYTWHCLAYDFSKPLDSADWLTFSSQTLLEMTKGEVFHDDDDRLAELREQLQFYPDEVWFYLLASAWQRIGQEEHLMLRAGYAGDELGSAVIASRLIRDVMNLGFLMERQYAPYPKWFGTAFAKLNCAEQLTPLLWKVQTATVWKEREQGMNSIYKHLAHMHNELGITEPVSDEATSFYTRPFLVMNGGDIGGRLANRIQDEKLQGVIRGNRLIGSLDLITDNTDFRMLNTWKDESGNSARSILKQFYRFGDES